MKIGTIGNFNGNLHVHTKNGKYFWYIEDHQYFTQKEQEITKELYIALVNFEANIPASAPTPSAEMPSCALCNDTGEVETNRIGYDSIMGRCPHCR